MISIYLSLDENGYVVSFGKVEYGPITENPEDSILVKLDSSHEIVNGFFGNWRYKDGELYKDDKKLLDDLKAIKKSELSQACQDCILKGFISEISNTKYHFSYDREAQMNYQERWQLFQNNMIDSIVMTAHDLDGSDARLEVDKKMFDSIYLDSVRHKENCIKRLRDDLFPLVDNSQSTEDLNAISWETEVLEPVPDTVVVKDDKLLNEEIKRIEGDSAIMSAEMLNLIMMMGNKEREEIG